MWRGGFESGAMKVFTMTLLRHSSNRLNPWVAEYSFTHLEALKLRNYFSSTTLKGISYGLGLKTATESYIQIANDLGVSEADRSSILFVSDNVKELIAVDKAGMQVAAADRPGNPPLPYPVQVTDNGYFSVLESGTTVLVVQSFTPLLNAYTYQR
ncbi:hypothetical protein BJ742DRAFT_733695 [Cladochytrium replicatum]|nr:hypothetical protein BJ742DRAFT_733695 [Cladochytrium replicatum]